MPIPICGSSPSAARICAQSAENFKVKRPQRGACAEPAAALRNVCAHAQLALRHNMEVRMAKLKNLVEACAILSCARASPVTAQEVPPPPAAAQSAPAANAAASSRSDARADHSKGHRRADPTAGAGRKGVSCQRDIFFKGEDGQMHLCK
jgi:hypothetical protein